MKEYAGQWLGRFSGTNSGLALLDLDLTPDALTGSFYAFDDDLSLPGTFVQVTVVPENKELICAGKPIPVDPVLPRLLTPGDIEDVNFPEHLDARLKWDNGRLKGTWSTDVGTSGTVSLNPSTAHQASQYVPIKKTDSWQAFQNEVTGISREPYRYIFRGQSEPWRLRTLFHRTNRKDLWHYWNTDIPRVRHASVGKTAHIFDPNNPEHNGAFMHLLQHHGYPTPMLDWTYSPYIAAYFAFASSTAADGDHPPVRIFMFDAKQWREDFNQITNVTLCRPHFSLLEPLAMGNNRALPQQSVAAITNLDDVEAYIEYRELEMGKSYLKVFDLPHSLRSEVLQQLGLMGISPGSLFPGIEGVCMEYRNRHFGYSR